MSRSADLSVNAAQIEYWNGTVSETWTQFQEQLIARSRHWVLRR